MTHSSSKLDTGAAHSDTHSSCSSAAEAPARLVRGSAAGRDWWQRSFPQARTCYASRPLGRGTITAAWATAGVYVVLALLPVHWVAAAGRCKRREPQDDGHVRAIVATLKLGRAAWPLPSLSCDSSCCALCQAEASELSAGAREAEQAMGVTGLDTHMGLERAHTPANSTGASAGSVEAGSGPRAATSASHSCEGSLKRSAEEAAAVALEAGAGEVSGGVARMVHGYASSSNLSASTEVEERVPVRSKRVRLMRLTGGATEACTGDSEAQPSCSASPLALEQRRWRSELAALSEPPPAAFVEVGAFERPQREVCGARQHYADIVCGVEFTADGRLLACAGVAKQVRVYAVGDLGDDLFADEAPQQPVAVHRLPQKMSSIAWCPDDEGIVTVGDYDGVVSQVHVASGHLVADVDEHDGRRVWSVAHSVQRRHLVASTSDDGTVRLWAGQGLRASAGVLRPAGGAPVCGAAFCSGDGNLLALAAADCRAYVYDLRATASPLAVLAAHTRPVSYARFLGRGEVVTASTDGSLALWDVAAAAAGGAPGARAGLSRTFRGHVNAKNFVGLAVCERERLLATGSETGAAVGYHTSWATPLAARAVVRARGPGAREFVSAIAWRPDSAGSRGPVLATALSNGDVRMLQLVAAA